MADAIVIEAQPRDRAGKGAARATRRAGLVPCVIYGDKKDPSLVAISPKTLVAEIMKPGLLRAVSTRSRSTVRGQRVLPRDIQYHPVNDRPLHVDFLRINDRTMVNVEIPVRFVNEEESPGLKRGGVLNVVRYEIEVMCAAGNIPEEFVIDLTGLDIGDSVHISMVDLPAGVEPTITDRDFTVAAVAAPTVVRDEAAEAAAAEGEEGEEIEGAEGEAAEGEGEGEAKEDEAKGGVASPWPVPVRGRHATCRRPWQSGAQTRAQPPQHRVRDRDEIARRYGFPPYRKRFQSETADGTIAGEKILLLKPQTFMNLSGQAVGEAMRFLQARSGRRDRDP